MAQGWQADDSSYSYDLPFTFNFSEAYNSVWVCTNGFLVFSGYYSSPGNSVSGLNSRVMIAPLWDDLTTYSPDDIYIHQPSTNSVCIRWDGRTLEPTTGLMIMATKIWGNGWKQHIKGHRAGPNRFL